MATTQEQPPYVRQTDFERRSAEFDRRFTHIDDGLRDLRQDAKDLAQGQKGLEQQLTVLAQEQKALSQRFTDFKENVDRRITTLTWIIALTATANFALFGWILSRLP